MYTYVATAVVAAVLAFGAGWKVQAWRYDSAALEASKQVAADAREDRHNANVAAGGHEADKGAIRTVFVPITQEVERVVNQIEYRDRACLADDGLRVLNEAIRATGAASEPGNPVSAPASSR